MYKVRAVNKWLPVASDRLSFNVTTPSLTRDGEPVPAGVLPVVLAAPPARAGVLENEDGEAVTGEALLVLALADAMTVADVTFPPVLPWALVLRAADVGVRALGVDVTDDSLDWA